MLYYDAYTDDLSEEDDVERKNKLTVLLTMSMFNSFTR